MLSHMLLSKGFIAKCAEKQSQYVVEYNIFNIFMLH